MCMQVLRSRGYDVPAVALMDGSGGNCDALRRHFGCGHGFHANRCSFVRQPLCRCL